MRRKINKKLLVGSVLLLALSVPISFANFISPVDPIKTNLPSNLHPPTWFSGPLEYSLGADALGRSILARLLYGGRLTIAISLSTVLIAASIGIPLGLISSYFGGIIDTVIMRIADIQLSLPPLLLVIVLISILGPGVTNMIVAVGLTGWTTYARTIRSAVLSLKGEEYVMAAQAIGCSNKRIIMHHIAPQVLNISIVVLTQQIGVFTLFAASLSFLGLGVQPPAPSWGIIVSEGRNYLGQAWWISTFPGIALTLWVLGCFLLGEGVREIFDPTLRRRM